MTIQFNLLPEIKIQYLKARRQKHLVVLGSVVIIIASVAVLAILISIVFGVQKKSISDLTKDIQSTSNELQNTPELNKMLTVQNQLKVLPSLHDAKPVVSRIYGYLGQATPPDASISRLHLDSPKQVITISGTAASLEVVNVFIDTLKATTYHTARADKTEKPAFSGVVLSSFGRDAKGATYTIIFKFDPVIFSELEDITFTVSPDAIRSQADGVFEGAEEGTGQ